MPDIAELIVAEHLRIRRLSAELDSLLAAADPAGQATGAELAWARLAHFLELHLDAAEEISDRVLAMADHGTGLDLRLARESNADIREAVAESRLMPPGSRPWRMAVQAAQTAALNHVCTVESGPLARFRLHAAPSARAALGDQWVIYMAARILDSSGPASSPVSRRAGRSPGGPAAAALDRVARGAGQAAGGEACS